MTKVLTGTRLLALGGILVLVTLFLGLVQRFDFLEILNPERLAGLLDQVGPMAPLVLIGAMILAVVVSPIPSLPLDLAAGVAFGPWLGTTYAVIGAEIGAIISFLIGRALGRDLLTRLLRTNVAFCEKCSDAHLVLLVTVARLVPLFSFDIVSYGAGLTNMSLKAFALATLVGTIPPTFALTSFGSSVTTAQWPLMLAGIVMVAVFVLAPKLVMRYPNAWWARVFLAAAPMPHSPTSAPQPKQPHGTESCSGCGEPLA